MVIHNLVNERFKGHSIIKQFEQKDNLMKEGSKLKKMLSSEDLDLQKLSLDKHSLQIKDSIDKIKFNIVKG